MTQLTLFIAVDLGNDDFARFGELLLRLLGRLVPDGGQHVGESAPVGVEVDEDELVVGQNLVHVLRVEHGGAAVDGVVRDVRHLQELINLYR